MAHTRFPINSSSGCHQDSSLDLERGTNRDIESILYEIQNGVEHYDVYQGIDQLWEYLVFKKRLKDSFVNSSVELSFDGLTYDIEKLSVEWRKTFSKFLSVEPSSTDDEALLSRVLDVSTFLITTLKDASKILEWLVPLVGDKNSALLRFLLQGSTTNTRNTSLTTLNSVFDFYNSIIQLTCHSDNSDDLVEFYHICTEILQNSHENGFTSSSILHSTLKSLALLTSSCDFIRKTLTENPEIVTPLLRITITGVRMLFDKMNLGAYRYREALQHGGVFLAHLSSLLAKTELESSNWISQCSQILPLFWTSQNSRVKANGLQIAVNITSNPAGVIPLISNLESPTFLWRLALTLLANSAEPSVVRERCTKIIINLITHWSQMKSLLGPNLEIPRTKLIQEIKEMLQREVSWNPGITGGYEDPNANEVVNGECSPILLSNCTSLIGMLVMSAPESEKASIRSQTQLVRELCSTLSRITASYSMAPNTPTAWQKLTQIALSNSIHALTCILEVDPCLSLALIGDRRNLSKLISYFGLHQNGEKVFESVSILWKNTFKLLGILVRDSSHCFDDLERVISSNRELVMSKILEWVDMRTPEPARKLAINFLNQFLNRSCENETHVGMKFWDEISLESSESYGERLCSKLVILLTNLVSRTDRTCIFYCLNVLCLRSKSACDCAVELHLVTKLMTLLRDLAVVAINSPIKKNAKYQEELKWIITLFSTLFYLRHETKEQGLVTDFGDGIHAVFKYFKDSPERILLHLCIECLINFTAEFVEGSQSLTQTSGTVGVIGSRKMTQKHSLFLELIRILEAELSLVDRGGNINLKTVELLISYLTNASFSIECRNSLGKTNLLTFLDKFHAIELRKWGSRNPKIKLLYLNLLVQLTIYSDMQLLITKIPDSIEIFITLYENEPSSVALCSLQILRNISFQSSNRPHLIHHAQLLPSLGIRLKKNDISEELECISLIIWAVTANSEKGKVNAKRAGCHSALLASIKRLQLKKNSIPVSDLITPAIISSLTKLMEKIANILHTSGSGDN